MNQLGRFAWIIGPCVLTTGSLICLIIVALGCRDANKAERLYSFRFELKKLTTSPNSVVSAGLWNYCAGDITADSTYSTTYCSTPQGGFWFDPVDIWGLKGADMRYAMPSELQRALSVYRTASLGMEISYLLAICANILGIVVGLLTGFCRLGICFTWLLTGISLLFTTAAAVTSTTLFSTLAGVLKLTLKPYGIYGHLGKNIYGATWLAVALSFLATMVWLVDCCCAPGRNTHHSQERKPLAGLEHDKSYNYNSLPAAGVLKTSYPPSPPPLFPPSQGPGLHLYPMNQVPQHRGPSGTFELHRHA
ncbi:integral membrane protein [Aspergillus uvarum CBS 121591]|uniref:Integral membrane protein n=1 Tax=Aspergillus uvarum CBS 121591 TaxID=1448315 RepID=A0A319DP28_9EURO|nr:integral membrane protein [Aspergillus uvarum CBS 121591]PYH81062.1 integral membrane protein [Aspergillus uvarum CBS 121591]